MNSRKCTAILLCLLVVFCSLAGCGKKKADETENTSSEPVQAVDYAPGFNDADGYVVFDIDGNIVSEVAATTSRNASGTVTTIDDNGVVTGLEGEDDGSSLSMEGWLPFK